ncbi:reverse transcriptase domain-containing protein [Tanacetum coccineum]
MLKRCEDTNLALNWEKSHFMMKEGIVLGHKISKKGIEVDKAKIDVIAKLPHPTTVKGIRSFLGHASFYRRFIKDFSKISRPMTYLLEKNTPFIFSEECIQAFQTLKKKLTEAPILIAPNWDQPFELMCDASDYAIAVRLGCAETKVATWDDLAFKLIILGWNVKHSMLQNVDPCYVYKIASTSNTSRSGEGSMQLTALEDELKSTKAVYNKSLITLTKRVKKLENKLELKRSTIVNSSEDEKASLDI